MRSGTDVMTDLVLLGAGHAHVEVLRRFARQPDPRLRLTLIAREPSTPYSGRLPALIRRECGPADAHIDLGPLTAVAGARLVVAEATAIDLAARQIAMHDRPAIRFDLLSIDIGALPAMPDGGGTDGGGPERGGPEHGGPGGGGPNGGSIAVKPIGGFLAALARLEHELADGARIALVGGGAAGTELALALAQRVAGRVRITLVCDTADPLPEAPPRARAVARGALAEARVELVCGVRAGAQADGRLALSDGSFLAVDAVLWATNVVGPPLLAESGLICDAAGCVVVDASLRSRSHEFVFAAGDCASMASAPRPKAGVWAVRAGPRLAANLRRVAHGQRPRRWRPQGAALAIVGLGHGRAVAWRNGVVASGRLVAWYKNWIDGRFVRRYAPAGLPRLGAQAEPEQVSLDPADLAVLSGATLHQARGGHQAPGGQAQSEQAPGTETALIQQATHLAAVLNDPFNFGRIAAAHALVRLHATGARPWTAVAVVTPSAAASAPARADVMAVLEGAAEVLAADGAALADCATASSGAPALSLVLSGHLVPHDRLVLTGHLVPPDRPGTTDRPGTGAQVGSAREAHAELCPEDALILTKPLGSGIILEGYRRGLAEAGWLLDALTAMTASSAVAAHILRQHRATACAAVAEHGLLGTLAALLRDANLSAALSADAIQALPGARALAHLGVERRGAVANRQGWPDPPDWPDLALLADPQIAGGLLAGVPAATAEACLAALHTAGYAAARIGQAEARRLDVPRLRLQAG
jgi:selenide,water dikinase